MNNPGTALAIARVRFASSRLQLWTKQPRSGDSIKPGAQAPGTYCSPSLTATEWRQQNLEHLFLVEFPSSNSERTSMLKAGDVSRVVKNTAVAAPRLRYCVVLFLGLTPQALCFRRFAASRLPCLLSDFLACSS